VQAIALNGREAVFWSNRASCYMKLGQYEEALADAEMARALKSVGHVGLTWRCVAPGLRSVRVGEGWGADVFVLWWVGGWVLHRPDWPKACYRMAEARLALRRCVA
jgi:tetratricopeptide (TPR) repeat protein